MKTNSFPSIEALETRIAPAGVVNVAFAGGSFTLTGDALDNVLTITATGPNVLTFSPGGGTTFTSGLPLSVFDPATGIFHGDITGKFTANLGAGNDTLFLANVTIPGKLDVNDLIGNNNLTLNNTRIGGDLNFTTGPGNDLLAALCMAYNFDRCQCVPAACHRLRRRRRSAQGRRSQHCVEGRRHQ